uniref:Uncharacterized protein n=1 Tax=Solanum tuberosum TaxID=4113 RepID=M1DUY7_SOLTU
MPTTARGETFCRRGHLSRPVYTRLVRNGSACFLASGKFDGMHDLSVLRRRRRNTHGALINSQPPCVARNDGDSIGPATKALASSYDISSRAMRFDTCFEQRRPNPYAISVTDQAQFMLVGRW